jgi:hypothetical protein
MTVLEHVSITTFEVVAPKTNPSEGSATMPDPGAFAFATPDSVACGSGEIYDLQRENRRPKELVVALLVALGFHGSLLVRGSYRLTYDAYVHLFFADHYRRSWFSTWEPRWYTGFKTVSYPPGSHQLLALTSKIVGLKSAFPIVAMMAILVLILGIYRFSLIWVDQRSAGYAAILASLSSSVAEALHVFGQLPTLLSLGLLLNGLPFAHRWIREGGFASMMAGLSFTAATTAVHHVTTLFGIVFFLGPVVVNAIQLRAEQPLHDEVGKNLRALRIRSNIAPVGARFLRRAFPAIARSIAYLLCVLIALVVVVLPYWRWSKSDPITQIPIPHGSRDNFFTNSNAGLMFFVIPWGLLLLTIPRVLRRGFTKRTWSLTASIALLFVLGTGGTTPIPKLLLGASFQVLTLDRFTFWATISILPFAGQIAQRIFSNRSLLTASPDRSSDRRIRIARIVRVGACAAYIVVAVFCANLSAYRPLQPAAIDPGPIVRFLEHDEHARWRYLTLGFGDQMAWVSAQTTAESVDGNYHSARRLPELTSSPLERLSGAKYSGVAGLGSLQQFLAYPEKYHLKFIFSVDHFYDPLLAASGWQHFEPLENGVALWQHDDVSPLPVVRTQPELAAWERVMWGIIPISALSLALVLLACVVAEVRWPKRFRFRFKRRLRRLWLKADLLLAPRASRIEFSTTNARIVNSRSTNGLLSTARKRALSNRRATRALHSAERHSAERPGRRKTTPIILGVVVLLTPLLVIPIAASHAAPHDEVPVDAVSDFYRSLDLRNLKKAFDRLDPDARGTFSQFGVERSLVNGLVASYGKLESIKVTKVTVNNDRAVVRANLSYLTALNQYVLPVSEDLRKIGNRWFLEPKPLDLSIPPEQLVVRSGVKYLGQGNRQISAGSTSYQDVTDRPALQVGSATLVQHAGQLSVVGELTNAAASPAYVTVIASLIGKKGELLSSYASAVGSAHTALPGEVVPFRIDFEGIAGLNGQSSNVDFKPNARTPLAIRAEDVAEVWLSAKGLVTTLDLDRSLIAQSISVRNDAIVQFAIRNDGLAETTIPHLFVTLRNAQGDVGWVDDLFVPDAIRPQRTAATAMAVTRFSDVLRLNVSVRVFASTTEAPQLRRPALIGAVAGWSSADLMLVGFTRVVG